MSLRTRPILECIPNFSEGRDQGVVDRIVRAIVETPGVYLLRRESDVDHNRSVVTFAGDPDAVVDAAVRGVAAAVDTIDLNAHTGQHPRMGAADVVPFVPLQNLTMDDAVACARRAADRIWNDLAVPVYLYEASAVRPEHRNLADLRRGQFEGIRDAMGIDPLRTPDIGDARVHPTAGVTAVGARGPLIAYNIQLSTGDVEIARKIARAVRQSSGGLRFVKALGFELKSQGVAQVSMNLVDFRKSSMHHAFEMVRREAERYGVSIIGSQIIGLVPRDALFAAAEYYLRIAGFDPSLVLENRLADVMDEK